MKVLAYRRQLVRDLEIAERHVQRALLKLAGTNCPAVYLQLGQSQIREYKGFAKESLKDAEERSDAT